MNRNTNTPGKILDQATARIRNTPVASGQVEAARERVWRHLNAEANKVVQHPAATEALGLERIQSCDDFRALIPAHLSASLTPTRRLLLEDHLHECVGCRKAMETAKHGTTVRTAPSARPARNRKPAFAVAMGIAAVVLLAVGLRSGTIHDFLWPIDVHAVTQTVNGGLYNVSGQDVRPISAGQRIERNQAVRTGTDSGAVLQLADGSRIEMSSRAELYLDRKSDGVTIKLGRGSVIVHAAKQRNGHLYLETPDCTVCVVGTVFSVNANVNGSRISVLEGEVQVQQGNLTQSLLPGQQAITNPEMGKIPLQQDIAWSQDANQYAALLVGLKSFSKDVEQRLGSMEMRQRSDLVPLVPENTVMLASLPNISQPLAESYRLFRQRMAENAALENWWSSGTTGAGGRSFDRMVQQMTRMGSFLGAEVIIAGPKVFREGPVVLADVTNGLALTAALRDEISLAGAPAPGIRVVENAEQLQAVASNAQVVVYVDERLMVVSTSARQIQRVLELRQSPSSSAFASTALYRRLEQAYTEGVGWLIAADLEQMTSGLAEALRPVGLDGMQQLVVEQSTGQAGAQYRAVLGFSGERHGPAAWLGAAGPMGSLEFVSPNAYGVSAGITKDPSLIVDDLFGLLRQNPKALEAIETYERSHNIDIRRDIAAPLGNEFLIAIDGPILPTPSWKIVMEVNDAARLQNAIQWSVSDLNREALASQRPGVALQSELIGGRTFYAIASPDLPTEVHYTFWAGYLILAPSRALLMEAIQNHDSGNNLGRSAAFRAQLPAGRNDASAIMYQNIQALTQSLPADMVQGGVNALPTLVCLYGEPDRIVMSSRGMLGMNIANLIGVEGMINATGVNGAKAR